MKLNNEYLLLVLRIILSVVFILAGIEKIAHPDLFSVAIDNYRMFPDFSINFIAITLPWIELITGILLLFGVAVRENALIINVLMLMFIVIVTVAIIRGLNIECGCFGTAAAQTVGITKIVENIFLLGSGYLLQKYNSSKLVF